MEKLHKKLIVCLLSAIVLTACGRDAIQTVDVTQLVPQTIEVTRVITQTGIVPQANVTSTGKEMISATPEPQPIHDKGYYDGIVVITQYYTFLGHGLYEEAYYLLSSSEQSHHNLDDYIANADSFFQRVEIITVEPYTAWSEQHGGPAKPDTKEMKRFAVEIRAWGEGKMSGSAVSGDLQLLFLTLVLEDGKWKINSFATAL